MLKLQVHHLIILTLIVILCSERRYIYVTRLSIEQVTHILRLLWQRVCEHWRSGIVSICHTHIDILQRRCHGIEAHRSRLTKRPVTRCAPVGTALHQCLVEYGSVCISGISPHRQRVMEMLIAAFATDDTVFPCCASGSSGILPSGLRLCRRRSNGSCVYPHKRKCHALHLQSIWIVAF